jgi:predicted protein tyrosine phosphatase
VKTIHIIDDQEQAYKQLVYEFPEGRLKDFIIRHFDSWKQYQAEDPPPADIILLDFFLSKDRMYGRDIITMLRCKYLICFSSKLEMSRAMAETARSAGIIPSENIFAVQKIKDRIENPHLGELLMQLFRGPKDLFPLALRCPYCGASMLARIAGEHTCDGCSKNFFIGPDGAIRKPDLPAKSAGPTGESSYPLAIFGQLELEELLASGERPGSHLISIANPGQAVPPIFVERFEKILRLEFFDVDDAAILPDSVADRRIPRPEDAEKVINFFNSHHAKAEGFVVHCWQGVSRSGAVGMGLLKLMDCPDERLADELQRIRPEASPHRLISEYLSRHLGPGVSAAAEEVRRRQIQKMRAELESLQEEL